MLGEQEVEERRDSVTFRLELRVYAHQAEAFAAAMTGNDDDVILAAETAMRERIGRVYDVELEELELRVPEEAKVEEALRYTGQSQPPLA